MGDLELSTVHYTQRTWAMNYVNACRHDNRWEEFSKKKVFWLPCFYLSRYTHTVCVCINNTIFRKPLLLLCLEKCKRSFVRLKVVKDQFGSKFQNPILRHMYYYVCRRSASSLEETLCSLKQAVLFLKEAFWNTFSELWLWNCITKTLLYKTLGLRPVSLVRLIGTLVS